MGWFIINGDDIWVLYLLVWETTFKLNLLMENGRSSAQMVFFIQIVLYLQ